MGGRAQLPGTARPCGEAGGKGLGTHSLGLYLTPATPHSHSKCFHSFLDRQVEGQGSPSGRSWSGPCAPTRAPFPACPGALRPGAGSKNRPRRLCPPRRGSGRPESHCREGLPPYSSERAEAALTARHHFESAGPTLRSWLCHVAREPARRWRRRPVSSSSHSREGLEVLGPDLFSCFCVWRQRTVPSPVLWRNIHVYTCLSLSPRPEGLLSAWGPGLGGAKSPNLDFILEVLELASPFYR